MIAPDLRPEQIARIAGFGMRDAADAYLLRPTTVEGIRAALDLARRTNRKIVLRGAGRSYGDAAIAPEAVALDLTRMRRILEWDPITGRIRCEAGVTIEQIWRHTLEDGWWPAVVSGTMYPTLGGALAMNIHGKNNFRVGTIGEHITEIKVLATDGNLRTLTPQDEAFYAVISGAGLVGILVEATLQLKKVTCGDLEVMPLSCRNWEEQFEAFALYEPTADYMVSWIDCFASGKKAGRGLFHAAHYPYGREDRASLRPEHQDLPDTILGFFPKSVVWRALKFFGNRTGMRFINWAKATASATLGHGKPHDQSLVGFSFLLDYVPNWRWAYLPHGFIQYQSFVPKEHARQVFAEMIQMQQAAKLESYLGVLKRHRPDRFLLSHAVDGYSLALDFRVSPKTWPNLLALCHRMNDLVLAHGGRFYLAKDSTLRPTDVQAYLGSEAVAKLRGFRKEFDPRDLLTSRLAERVRL